MKIRLIQAKSVLNRSKIGDGYTLNPYVGCPHGCIYCYNQHFIGRLRPDEKWGQFLDVKINAPEILAKEILKKPKMPVFLSTVTDPYQSLEQKYRITNKCLKILIKNQWPISILTKSNLVLRDLNLFKEFSINSGNNQSQSGLIEIGFTLTTLDDRMAKIIEPRASLPSERLKALSILKQTSLKTYAFIGPVLPGLTDLSVLFLELKEKVNEIWLDTLNTNLLNWQGIKRTLQKYWPKLLLIYEDNFFKNRKNYENQLRKECLDLSQKYQIPIRLCF